ncbi:hypothetical protein ACOMHN_037358 [Nucella lapillus]
MGYSLSAFTDEPSSDPKPRDSTDSWNSSDSWDSADPWDSSDPSDSPDPWDSSDPFFSASTRDLMQKVLKCYIRQLIVFVGIPGNLLCCAVFLKQGLSDKINLLLFWLAVSDLSVLLAQLFLMPGCYLLEPLQAANWDVISNTVIVPVTWAMILTSGTLVMFLSVDRCLSVVLPFRAKMLLNYRLTVAAIFVSYLIPLSLCIYRLTIFTFKWKIDPSTNQTIAYTAPTSWFPTGNRFVTRLSVYFSVVVKPVFLVAMIVFCDITVLHLRRASRARGEMGGNVTKDAKAAESRITVMLLVICCLYVILTIPEITASITEVLVPEFQVFRKYHNSLIVYYQFIWIAACLNSAFNFFPYITLSSRFQRTLQDLCFGFANKMKSLT